MIEDVTHKSEEWEKFWASADDAFWLKYYDEVAPYIDADILDYLDEVYNVIGDEDVPESYFMDAGKMYCRRHSPHLVSNDR